MNRPRIVRWLRIAWTVAWGVAAVLLVALWARSDHVFDRASGRVFGRASVICVSYAGSMTAVFTDANYLRWDWPKLDSGPILPINWTLADLSGGRVTWDDTDVVWPYRGKLGFSWIRQTLYLNMPNSETGWDRHGMSGRSWGANSTGVMVPHWFGASSFASMAGLPFLRWRFSLRTMLIATTLVAVGLGLIVWLKLDIVGCN
jgi:hypothetical protein